METQKQLIEKLVVHTEELATTTVELMKLKAVDTSIRITSGLLSGMVIGFLFGAFLIFGSLGLSIWIGERLGEVYQGFLIVAGLYCLLTLLGYAFLYKRLERILGRWIIQKSLE